MARALGIVVACTVLVVLVGCGRKAGNEGGIPPTSGQPSAPPPPPAVPFPPPNWTHRDFADHLGRQGIVLTVRDRPLLSREDRVVAALSDDRATSAATVVVYRFTTEAGARELAAAEGGGAFAIGLFAVVLPLVPTDRDRDLLKRVEAALKNPNAPAAVPIR
jgi:hypothetical protein